LALTANLRLGTTIWERRNLRLQLLSCFKLVKFWKDALEMNTLSSRNIIHILLKLVVKLITTRWCSKCLINFIKQLSIQTRLRMVSFHFSSLILSWLESAFTAKSKTKTKS
jgi:hypothetical protein